MASKQDVDIEQASVQTNLSSDATHGGPENFRNSSHVGTSDNSVPVIVNLLRQVPSLSPEEPEAILRLVSRLDEIHTLGLMDDNMFIVCILPLLSGVVLRFVGDCTRDGRNWEQCRSELLKEFFPHFVRQKRIRDQINFHEGQSLCEYVDSVCRG